KSTASRTSLFAKRKTTEAKEIFTRLVSNLANPSQPDDYALEAAKHLDLIEGGNENFGKVAPQIAETEHLRRGAIYQFNRSFPLARLHYLAIVERYPNGINVPFASYQIGRSFAQEGDFSSAVDWYERILAQFPSDPVAKDALYQSASAFARLSKPKESVSRYKRFIEQFPDAENLDRAYLNIIDVLRDQGGDNSVLQWAQKTQETFRGKLAEPLALFAQSRIRLEQNDWQNAIIDLDKLLLFSDLGGTRVAGGTSKTEVTFLKGFALESQQKYSEAIEIYLSIPDGRSEYYGWRSTERLRNLRNDERTREAISIKLSELVLRANSTNISDDVRRQTAQNVMRLTDAPDVRAKMLEIIKTLYAKLPAYQKVPDFKLLELGRKEVLKETRKNLSQNPHQTLADELLFLALYDEAAPELESAQKNPQTQIPTLKSKDFNFTLATIFKRGDWANRAIIFNELNWRNIPADYEIELIPRGQLELLYPTPYVDSLLKFAPERNVDPRFILAIMRQESHFRADVKSNAAARGLMQFISTTADKIANELNRKNFRQDELYNPPTAILFGSQYLGNLFKQFPNQPQAVAASYNGGEDNVARWLKRANSNDADKYTAEIVFSQSKDYIYKVMASYRVYQILYDEKLQNEISSRQSREVSKEAKL
ncbi:MAG TPA: transglycosylase SLT domain-containing protein, partial [Pyrinomonadaceae bacterium]|nr:transglycosylase SLT domain-containing protein [Pyrinomonadaceae bacterium]